MLLGLLAVECVGHAAPVVLLQRYSGDCGEWNALVGWPEQHVELDPRARDRGGIAATQECGRLAVAEESGIEEIGAFPAGLELEMAKPQRIARQREVDEGELVVLHGEFPRDLPHFVRSARDGATCAFVLSTDGMPVSA